MSGGAPYINVLRCTFFLSMTLRKSPHQELIAAPPSRGLGTLAHSAIQEAAVSMMSFFVNQMALSRIDRRVYLFFQVFVSMQ